MARLKIGAGGSNPVVPGQEEAKADKEKEKQRREQENLDADTPLLYTKESQQVDLGPDYLQQKVRFHKKDEINPYADEQDARHALDYRTKRNIALGIALVVVVFFACTLPTDVFSNIYRTDHSIGAYISEFNASCQALLGVVTGHDSMFATHVWEVIAAVFAGAALALSGGIYQGALRNALASPSTLGVMNGGTLGIIIYGIFMYNGEYTGQISEYNEYFSNMTVFEQFSELFGQYAASLLGCGIVVSLILLIATFAGRGHVTNVSLIIAGQVFASVIAVIINWIRFYLISTSADAELVELLESAQSSSFTGNYTMFSTVVLFIVPLVICMVIVFALSNRLTLLAFNDEEARSMGVSTTATRNVMVAVCTVMTALVVSFVGAVGFVGFMVPHIARNLVGPNFKYLLPACMLIGALLVTGTLYVSELGITWLGTRSTGMITSIVGSIAFVIVAFRSRGGSNGVWR